MPASYETMHAGRETGMGKVRRAAGLFVTATLHLEEVEEEGRRDCVFARCTNIAEEFTGVAKGVGPRLRECYRQGQAEVVSNSRNKTLQTWSPLVWRHLYMY